MNKQSNYYRPYFLLALALHVFLFLFLFVHFTSKNNSPAIQSSPNIIKAVTVSSSVLSAQMTATPPVPQPPKPILQQAQTSPQPIQKETKNLELAQQTILHQEHAQQLKQQMQKAAEQQEAVEKEHKIVQQKIQAEQAAAKAQQKVEQAQQNAEAKIAEQKAAAQQKAEQRAEKAEELAKAAELKKQEAQKAAIAKQLIEKSIAQDVATTENKQTQEAQEKQVQTAKLATQQLLQQEVDSQTQAQAQQAQSEENQGKIDKYKALIIQAISQQWIVPQSVQDNETGKLLVTLAPGGMVLSVQIVQSSGDAALDRSARAAVFKASPLPVPDDSALFENFRQLNLTVAPQGITSG